eukprot:3933665-Rhodomonas_salina.1
MLGEQWRRREAEKAAVQEEARKWAEQRTALDVHDVTARYINPSVRNLSGSLSLSPRFSQSLYDSALTHLGTRHTCARWHTIVCRPLSWRCSPSRCPRLQPVTAHTLETVTANTAAWEP